MGALEEAIANAIKAQVDRLQVKQVLTGTIKEVGETTCTVEREDAPTLYDVRLNAIDDDLQSYVTIYPAVGSSVMVGIIECLKTEAIVLRCSEVDQVKMKIGEQTLLMDKDGVVFNGGDNKGLVKITEMVSWMQKLYTDMQALKAQLNAWPVVGNGAPLALVFNPTITNPTISSFEDTKIKH